MLVLQKNNESGLNGGLNGFWGKIAKKLIKLAISAVSTVPLIGPVVADGLTEVVNSLTNEFGGEYWNRMAEGYEPTDAEASVLEAWSAKFNIFYKSLATELANALNQASVQNQVTGINGVLSKMCTVKSYYLNYEKTGLSASAQQLRVDIIAELFKPFEELILGSAPIGYMSSPVSFSVPSTVSGYSPLFSTIQLPTVNCFQYVSQNNITLPDPIRSNPTTPTKTPVFTTPTKTGGITINPIKSETPATTLPVLPVGSENTIPNTLPASDDTKSNSTRNGIFLVGGLAVLWALFGGKKKKKVSN